MNIIALLIRDRLCMMRRRCHGVTKAYSDFIQRLLTLSPKKEDEQCLLPDNEGPFMTAALYLYSDVRAALVSMAAGKVLHENGITALFDG